MHRFLRGVRPLLGGRAKSSWANYLSRRTKLLRVRPIEPGEQYRQERSGMSALLCPTIHEISTRE